MLTHLPILLVIVPLIAAPACLVLREQRPAWILALLASGAAMTMSWLLMYQVWESGVVRYELGGWEAPWGIEYRIDLLSGWLLLVVSTLGFVVLTAAEKGNESEVPARNRVMFYVLYLLCLAGLLGIVATGDIFNVFVFLEISSLATYALIACGDDRRALWASYQYLIVGTIGATFFLIGIGFLYSMTGTLNMLDVSERLAELDSTRTVATAFAFIIIGVCLKLALFPLHLWLPNAYAFAPGIVTAFLAATATKVAVYLLIRFYYTVFGPAVSSAALPVHTILMVLGLAGVFVASAVAIHQTNIKRLFAYSSVAQVGYLALGLGLGSATALQATLLHIFNHALMKAALFLAIAGLVYRTGSTAVADLKGLGRRMPWTSAAIVAGGFSLIGVPLTAGFISKWYLVMGALEAGLWPVAILIVLGSLLAVAYVWRLVEHMYFADGAPGEHSDAVIGGSREAPEGLLLPTWLLVAATVYFGLDTRLPIAVTESAARYLTGGAS